MSARDRMTERARRELVERIKHIVSDDADIEAIARATTRGSSVRNVLEALIAYIEVP
jgi:hypothetical protein